MKIMLNIWILLGALVPVVISQSSYDSDHLVQDAYKDQEEKPYHPPTRSHQYARSYEPASYEEPSSDPKHYQSLEPETYHKNEPEQYSHSPRYYAAPQQVQYHQPEDPSYHRPQEIAYHHQQQPQYHQPEGQSYQRPQEVAYHQQQPQHYQEEIPQHQGSYEGTIAHHAQPEEKHEEPKYALEEPKYVQQPRPSRSSHPAPVPTDPKLPLYFTMYEKRVIQDPLNKYGKGPWRYLTYGHGITYGSKEPGKVFEKGYGYIRALGRDHCKLPEHLCPPRDEKPFDYDGRKEPYFGYRPH